MEKQEEEPIFEPPDDIELEAVEYAKGILPEIIKRSPTDFNLFMRSLIIPSATGVQRFNDCIQDFQVDTFKRIQPSIEAIRNNNLPPTRRFWIERTKKASKDADVAIIVLWLIAFAKRPIKIQICAANRKQARIIENRAVELIFYNKWLDDYVEIVEGQIRNRRLKRQVWAHIEATDSQGAAHGETPDLLILNELVHVAKWKAMADHMQNADGTTRSVVIVATNAGIKGTPAWEWRKIALDSPRRWAVMLWSKPSPWSDPESVAEARRRDPVGSEFRRLWEGQWISGMGDALTEEEIEGIFSLPSFIPTPGKDWIYLAGLDLGVSKDHAGVVLLGIHKQRQLIRVGQVMGFVPTIIIKTGDKEKREVDSDAVEKYVHYLHERFRFISCSYDPAAGGSFMAQRFRKAGIVMNEIVFQSSVVQTRMATTLVQVVKSKILQCYDDEEGRIKRDLNKFSIEHKPPSSYKLVAVADEYGHADVGMALALTLPKAVEYLGGWSFLNANDSIAVYVEDDELTVDDLNSMPAEFRETIENGEKDQYEMDELDY